MAGTFVLIIFVSLLFSGNVNSNKDERKSYEGYKVLEVTPIDRQTVKFLQNLRLHDIDLDFWTMPNAVRQPVKFMIPPHRISDVSRTLKDADISYVIRQDNVQKELLDPMWQDIDKRAEAKSLVFNIEDFNTLVDINTWMNSLLQQCRPGLTCQLTSIGTSFNNQPINVFRITKPDAGRRSYFIDATIHAREWITTATTLKVLQALVLGTNADAARLVDAFDWHILPVANPDGYMYTWTNDRLWQKNRKPNGGCIGTDLNLNFNYAWGTDGASSMPCSINYCGTGPASEPETVAIQNEIRRLAPSTRAAITLLAFGNRWMIPWSHTVNRDGEECSRTPDHDQQMVVSNLASDAIQSTYNTTWLVGNGCEILSELSGTLQDYMKGGAGISHTFSLQLRGGANEDYVLDRSNITPSFNEFWNGLLALVNALP